MGILVEGNFPNHRNESKEFKSYPEIIDGRHLIYPINRTEEIIFGNKPHEGTIFSHIAVLESDKQDQNYFIDERPKLDIYTDLNWLEYISKIAEQQRGHNFAELVQAHLLTSIYAKKWIDSLDNNAKRVKILDVKPCTKYEINGQQYEIDYHRARDVELWRAASAIALKSITHRGANDRIDLIEFLNEQFDYEMAYELDNKNYKNHKNLLGKLASRKINKTLALDTYKSGVFTPMSDHELLALSTGFIRAANN